MLTIKLKKLSPTHHQLEYRRPDGSGESLQLDTRSFLYHDLLHFAVESEAQLKHSFYGSLARANSYADLAGNPAEDGRSPDMPTVVLMTERTVGMLTGLLKQQGTPEDCLVTMKNLLDAAGETVPEWLTTDFIVGVQQRMRQLLGHWNGTPFGQTMEIVFQPE